MVTSYLSKLTQTKELNRRTEEYLANQGQKHPRLQSLGTASSSSLPSVPPLFFLSFFHVLLFLCHFFTLFHGHSFVSNLFSQINFLLLHTRPHDDPTLLAQPSFRRGWSCDQRTATGGCDRDELPRVTGQGRRPRGATTHLRSVTAGREHPVSEVRAVTERDPPLAPGRGSRAGRSSRGFGGCAGAGAGGPEGYPR